MNATNDNWANDWEGAWIALEEVFGFLATREDSNGFGYRPDWQVWIEVVLWQALFIFGIGFGIRYVCPIDPWIAYGVAAILWALIFFFARGVDMFVVNIVEFHAAVLTSGFNRNRSPDDDLKRVKLERSRKFREVDFGLRPKRPWETATIIDMRKQRMIKKTLKGYSSDGIGVTINILLPIRPLPGFLPNLVRHTENTIDGMLISTCEAFVEEYMSKREQLYILNNLAELKELFRKVYGGSGSIHEAERECGVFTDEPILSDFERSKKFQESAEALMIAKNTANAVKALLEIDPDMGGKAALDAVLATEGDATMTITAIRGLENLKYAGGAFLPMGGQVKHGKGKQRQQQEEP